MQVLVVGLLILSMRKLCCGEGINLLTGINRRLLPSTRSSGRGYKLTKVKGSSCTIVLCQTSTRSLTRSETDKPCRMLALSLAALKAVKAAMHRPGATEHQRSTLTDVIASQNCALRMFQLYTYFQNKCDRTRNLAHELESLD